MLLDAIPLPDPTYPAPFTVEDVRQQMSRCKTGKAQGPDGIQAQVLKECAMELSPIQWRSQTRTKHRGGTETDILFFFFMWQVPVDLVVFLGHSTHLLIQAVTAM